MITICIKQRDKNIKINYFSIFKRAAISTVYCMFGVAKVCGGTLQALRAGGHVPFPILKRVWCC
jgi:hypothetical protein